MRFRELTQNSILDVSDHANPKYSKPTRVGKGRACNLYALMSMKITIKLHLTGKARLIYKFSCS